jgi:glycosyltransferase involved in cell wall biosynthesis
MRVIVNALSATSLSGRHVLRGHLAQLARFAEGQHEFWVLCPDSHWKNTFDPLNNVHWIEVGKGLEDWKRRMLWELCSFPRILQETRADVVFTPSGTIIPGCRRPQVSLAQNPWCLIRDLHSRPADRVKAFVQRRAYRYAASRAALMAYNSEFMRQAYRRNAGGRRERDSLIAYQGLDDETHAAAAEMRAHQAKEGHTILAVSVMARWKNIETLVDSLGLLHEWKVPATLNLVGPWPDASYERAICERIDQAGLAPHVTITGQVSRAELYRQYARASVFCLLSRCESFGIPALEAQLFGTPSVISNDCAMPEICGCGALSVPPDDPALAARALALVLQDAPRRRELTVAAVENASRFRWSECSRPLFRMFDLTPDHLN